MRLASNVNAIRQGVSLNVGGAATITGLPVELQDMILLRRKTAGGGPGHLSSDGPNVTICTNREISDGIVEPTSSGGAGDTSDVQWALLGFTNSGPGRPPGYGFNVRGVMNAPPAAMVAGVSPAFTNLPVRLDDIVMVHRYSVAGTPGWVRIEDADITPCTSREASNGQVIVRSSNALDTSRVGVQILSMNPMPNKSPMQFNIKGWQFGYATLVAGTIVVPNVAFRPGDMILLSRSEATGVLGFESADDSGGGVVYSTNRETANGSFTINSSNAGDTSVFQWAILSNGNT